MQRTRPVIKPNKQRKMLYQAPAHIRHKIFGSPLSPQLRGTNLIRTFPVRKGDTIRVMRGDHKGLEGKISRIDLREYRVYVEGLTREKVDGSTVSVAVHPSKIMIINFNLDDKWRRNILDRKKKAYKKPKPAARRKIEEKPPTPEIEELAGKTEEAKPSPAKEMTEKTTSPTRRRAPKKTKPESKGAKAEKTKVAPKKTSRRASKKQKEDVGEG